jgi:hypothetical protein
MVYLLILNDWLKVSHHVVMMDFILFRCFIMVLLFKHWNLYIDALIGLFQDSALIIDWFTISMSKSDFSLKESILQLFIAMETDFFKGIFLDSLGVSREILEVLWLMEINLFWMGVCATLVAEVC